MTDILTNIQAGQLLLRLASLMSMDIVWSHRLMLAILILFKGPLAPLFRFQAADISICSRGIRQSMAAVRIRMLTAAEQAMKSTVHKKAESVSKRADTLFLTACN